MPHGRIRQETTNSSPITRSSAGKKKSFRKVSASAPTWDEVKQGVVYALVCSCATSNSPATLSYTRDGTALVVSVYHDGERYVDYLADNAEVEAYLHWLLEELLPLSSEDIKHYLAMLS